MYRVVFDTNIFLSAFIFGGNPREAFEKARTNKIQLITSPAILTEFAGRLKDKFLWDTADIADAVKTIGYVADLVKPKEKITIIKDEPDNRILECALEGKADYIVSGDRHLLELKEFESIIILKAKTLVEILKN